MARDTTVQFRMDASIKEGAFAVFREMGMSPSEAVRIFFKHVQKTKTLPFIITANTIADEEKEDGYDEWLRARLTNALQALDNGEMKSYSSAALKENLATRRAEWRAKQPTISSNE